MEGFDAAEQLDSGNYAAGIVTGNAKFLVSLCADGDINGIIVIMNLFQGNVFSDTDVCLNLDTAGGKDRINILIQHMTRKTIARDTIAEHTAKALSLFEDGYIVTHQGQVVGCGKACRTAADNSDFLAGAFASCRNGNVAGCLAGIALEAADIDRVINHIAAAACLAGMLANQAAGYRERIVLADQANCICAASGMNQRNVSRNINACRAESHAGNGLVQAAEAAVVANMLQIVITETDYAAQNHVGGLKADCAVSGILDDSCSFLNEFYGVFRCSAIHNLLKKCGKLCETYTARYTFAAGLCVAQFQK